MDTRWMAGLAPVLDKGYMSFFFTGVCLIDEISVLGLGQPHVSAYNTAHKHDFAYE